MSMTYASDSVTSRRLARYRAMAESARHEANRTAGEARESYLFIAQQWERLAELAQKPAGGPSTSFG